MAPRQSLYLLRLLFSLLLPLLFSVPATAAETTFTIAYQPITSASTPSKPITLANIRYNGTALALDHYAAPSSSSSLPSRVRIGLLDARADALAGSSTLALSSVLSAAPGSTVLRVVLDHSRTADEGADTAVRVLSADVRTESARQCGADPCLELVRAAPEPRPLLNRPVVLNEQGQVEPEEKPKTLLQRYASGSGGMDAGADETRYWWVLAAIVLVSLLGGGDS